MRDEVRDEVRVTVTIGMRFVGAKGRGGCEGRGGCGGCGGSKSGDATWSQVLLEGIEERPHALRHEAATGRFPDDHQPDLWTTAGQARRAFNHLQQYNLKSGGASGARDGRGRATKGHASAAVSAPIAPAVGRHSG